MNPDIIPMGTARSAADLFAFDITANCTLVKLACSQFSGRKKDEDLASDVAAQNRGVADAYETFLKVLPDATRKAIQQIVTKARSLYKFHTTPWDTGWALVNNKQYEKLMTELEQLKLEFDAAVQREVLDKRDELAAQSDLRLGKRSYLFPFPTTEQLREEYGFKVETMPIPNPKDLRLQHISSATARKIEAQTTQVLNDRLKGAMTTVVSRLRAVVERVFLTLSDDDKIFRDSMVENVKALCGVIPELNITNDKFIATVADEIAASLGNIDCEKVRENVDERKAAAKKAGEILGKLDRVKITPGLKAKPDLTAPVPPLPVIAKSSTAKPATTPNGAAKGKTGIDRLKSLHVSNLT